MSKENTMRTPYKYELGEIIENLKIINREHKIHKGKFKKKIYTYQCLKCTNVDQMEESKLGKHGCNVCCTPAKKVVEHINSLYAVRPELVEYFKDREITKRITVSSSKKVELKCPLCGYEKEMTIDRLTARGFSCPVCTNDNSLPEKMMSHLLHQKGIKFESEKIFEWSKNVKCESDESLTGLKRYDFYIPALNMIIELHGGQHYIESTFNTRTLYQEQLNDNIKKEVATKNGIEEYHVIDCRNSTYNHLKKEFYDFFCEVFGVKIEESIMQQCFSTAMKPKKRLIIEDYKQGMNIEALSDKYGMNKRSINKVLNEGNKIGLCNKPIRQDKEEKDYKNSCLLYSQGSTVKNISKEVGVAESTIRRYLAQGSKNGLCNYTNDVFNKKQNYVLICKFYNENKDIQLCKIAEIFNVHVDTVVASLKKGNKEGICTYEFAREKEINAYKDGVLIGRYPSAKKLVDIFKEQFDISLMRSCISECCQGKRKQHKGYTFSYAECE